MAAGAAVLFSSCVRDGEELCGSYVRFVYDYNMEREDLFGLQASKIDLFLFDAAGSYIGKVSDERSAGTFPQGYRMRLPEGLPQAVQFVAWLGLYEDQCEAASLTPGVSTIDDLNVSLKVRPENRWNTELKPVWYGKPLAGQSPAIQYANEVTVISLVKDTKTFRLLLKPAADGAAADVNDYRFVIESRNGSYDSGNNPADDVLWHYEPFYTANGEAGIVAHLNTLRLFKDRENRLVITHKPSGTPVVEMDLNAYINTLRLEHHSGITDLQEYMDRESDHDWIIYRAGNAANR